MHSGHTAFTQITQSHHHHANNTDHAFVIQLIHSGHTTTMQLMQSHRTITVKELTQMAATLPSHIHDELLHDNHLAITQKFLQILGQLTYL